jgi:hypothetical protein
MATWPAPDGGRPASAPVLLVPMRAALKGQRGTTWTLRRSGEPRCNVVLVHALAAEHGVTLAPDDLLGTLLGDEDGETFDLEPLFDRVARLAAAVAGFAIERRWVIGNFSFQKMSIVRDLKDLLEPLARHDIIAGIAGDGAARDAQAGRTTSIRAPSTVPRITDSSSSTPTRRSSRRLRNAGRPQRRHLWPAGHGQEPDDRQRSPAVAAGKTVLRRRNRRRSRSSAAAPGSITCASTCRADVSQTTAQQLARSIDVMRDPPHPTWRRAAFADRRTREPSCRRHAHAAAAIGPVGTQIYGRLLRLPRPQRGRGSADRAHAQFRRRPRAQRLLTERRRPAHRRPVAVDGHRGQPRAGGCDSTVPGLANDLAACVRQLDALWRRPA